MKTKILTLAVAILLFGISPPALGAGDTVAVSAAEFQRMVYSAHLYTKIEEKPELDAALQVLLALHRRNPHADPAALAGVVQQATAAYRANAPAYVRISGYRDEILAAYLDALRHVPARTNFVLANLQLLNGFMLQPADSTNGTAAELIHSGNQRFFATEGKLEQRRRLLDTVTERAGSHPVFAAALDILLASEVQFSVADEPAAIIGSTNSPLHDNFTMHTLLMLSTNSGNGSLTVSSNLLVTLFANETHSLWQAIDTNLALRLEFNQSHPDLLAYLTNQAAQADWEQRESSVRQGQARTVASAAAAIMVHSQLAEGSDAPSLEWLGPVGDVVGGFFTLAVTGNPGPAIAGAFKLVGLFADQSESPAEAAVREIRNVQTLIGDLSNNMGYRFDRVDQSLTTIFETLNEEFSNIKITLDSQGHLIAQLTNDVHQIQNNLVDVQTDLHRLERQLFIYFNESLRQSLVLAINGALFYEIKNPGRTMTYDEYALGSSSYENTFYTYATEYAHWAASSPSAFSAEDLSPGAWQQQLAARPLDANLNYIKEVLAALSQATDGAEPISNPRDWFTSAYAYAQLAVENPMHYRTKGLNLPIVISHGEEIVAFFRSLTFRSGHINSNLYTAFKYDHVTKLNTFLTQVSATEQQYANDRGFALDTWRQWSDAAPRRVPDTTEVLVTYPLTIPAAPRDAMDIAAGRYHTVVLKRDGTVIAWGGNEDGQSTVPAGATNIVAIAAGMLHSLALSSSGGVVAWGNNTYGQTNTPTDATNMITLSAGHYHSLALRADGTVLAWGRNNDGQSTIPGDATNIVAIAAGGYHSLALREDGTLVGWGLNNEGQVDFPASTTNVIAIAAGHGHNLALKNDGTLLAWGNNIYGSTDVPTEATNIVAIAAAGWHCLAKRADGKVFSWGRNDAGQTAVPFSLGGVQKLAAGLLHSVALKEDGTVVSWGANNQRQALVPPALSWKNALSAGQTAFPWRFVALKPDGSVTGAHDLEGFGIPDNATNGVAIAAGVRHFLLLQANGSVLGWGEDYHGETSIPASATNVMGVAAGDGHSLALRADGTVVGWGYNDYGAATGVPDGPVPGLVEIAGQTLSNVVAVAAGPDFSLALRSDGTVVGWGYNPVGQATGVPTTNDPGTAAGVVTIGGQVVTNVVAIAGGGTHSLALRADGSVVAWGENQFGQTNIPANLTGAVAIAAGNDHSLALLADGTVIGWGANHVGQSTVPAAAISGAVAIAAGEQLSVVLRVDGTIVAWGAYFEGHTPIPTRETNVISVASGELHSLALKADGTVVGWGSNGSGQANGASAGSNVVAIAAGDYHSLALRADGTVVGWGDNSSGQRDIPAGQNHDLVAIAAGDYHSLALRANGTVVGWGYNFYGQANGASAGSNVVAIAARYYHSLALKADGRVVGWGYNAYGQANGASAGSNVVAIAAGVYHSLALKADGTVVGWGSNGYGQANGASAGSNVVAIAAGDYHSIALKADGTVIAWGRGDEGQTTIPPGANNVIAIAGNDKQSLFVTATGTGGFVGINDSFVARAQIPRRVGELLYGVTELVLSKLDFDFHDTVIELSGTKAMLQAVLELGMPYTLEQDDVLRGFLYGSEPLVELGSARAFLEEQAARLGARPDARAQSLVSVAVQRYLRFSERLDQRLNDLAATGQPELPRLVSHTLRLLNLLRDAWTQPTNSPPPALEIGRENNGLRLGLYGEPYAHYMLQYRDSLSVPGWSSSITNLHSEQFIAPSVAGPSRFYRAVLPVP